MAGMTNMDAAALIRLFEDWNTLFVEQRAFLIALDGKVGDSDLGITMNKAFAAAAVAVTAEGAGAAPAKLLRTAGATIARVAPSTMGTLTATGFLRASKVLEGHDRLGTPEVAALWKAFRDGVAERGKAKPGDKTVLDVLDPIAATMSAQAEAGADLPTALTAAAAAAETALRGTEALTAQHGKAAAFREKTIGLQDAGATVAALLISQWARFSAAN